MKAVWNNKIIAESEDTIVIENNYYFPAESIKKEYFSPSTTHTIYPWKGTASYYNITVDGVKNNDAAWYYPEISDLAKAIKGRIAFWKGVTVTD
ncbi:DUF427 domain-containing protein [Arenibacter sp. BSSL-BM3]|uniref:DUF427 domain-containing protein n=1 Tax=Arenibacter arenosicollis TaxID=2762274 RepID=A0ABR7QK96_9FLAO|nr:DUF427 domain-containing protein [Arenibacter arenosicollis]MBC8767616.1 DUF427 domain-containing protein [Arenibacter arenosicollis]